MHPQTHRNRSEARGNPRGATSGSNGKTRFLHALLAVACLGLASAQPADAQYLPSKPLTLAGGRISIGGDVQAGIAPRDEESWFNYTDYEHDALRMVRWSVAGEWRVAARLALLAELRGENTDAPYASAAYVRARPFSRIPLDIQAGRIPPTFGAFGRRVYSTDNPLVGYPLAYQYLLSIRPDAIPASPRELLTMRARGWLPTFSIGSVEARTGVPVINGFHWDTGVQARIGNDTVQGAMAVTQGTLSQPRVSDDNDGKQVSARFQLQPAFGLVLGMSGARGSWLDRNVQRLVAPGQPTPRQQMIGLDAEYSRGHWIVRGEAIRSTWNVPGVKSARDAMDLVATSGWIEGRYRLTPRLYVAGRLDHLGFSRIEASAGAAPLTWEAPVSRVEAGAGLYLQRNVVARFTVQRNTRDGGRVRERTFVATQVVYWF